MVVIAKNNMAMRHKLRKLNSCFAEPLAFLPLFFGLSGVIMSPENWDKFGYAFIPQIPFCVTLIVAGIIAYYLRWYQRKMPIQWGLFVKISALFYLALGFSIVLEGSLTGAVLFLTNLLYCRKEIMTHKIFTKYHRMQ